MGLAASQARLLTITARKADCEFESMKLSHEKIALSRDMERISDEYQNAMNKTKLIYDYYGTGTSDMALTYGLLMTPSVYNDYYPKLLTDNVNRVVLNGPYATAAKAAGIPIEGYNGTPSSEVRNLFIESLRDSGVIAASTAASIESVSYNNAVGLGATFSATTATQDITYDDLLEMIKAYSIDTKDYGVVLGESLINSATPSYPDASLSADGGNGNNYWVDAYDIDGSGNSRSLSNKTGVGNKDSGSAAISLYDLLAGKKEYVLSGHGGRGPNTPLCEVAILQQIIVGTENSNSFLNWMVDQFSAVLGGVAENDLALQYAYDQVYQLVYPDEKIQDLATKWKNDGFTTKGRNDQSDYSCKNKDGNTVTDLRYARYEIASGKPDLHPLPHLTVLDGADCDTLKITLRDPYTGVEADLYYTVFNTCDVITKHAVVRNCGTDAVILDRALSLSVDLPTMDYDLITLWGRHVKERQFERRPLAHGIQGIHSKRGSSSHSHNPFAALIAAGGGEDTGDAYGFNFIYSGNYEIAAEVDHNATTRLVMGIDPTDFEWNLAPGEAFTTPEAVMVFSCEGLGGMSRTFHRAYNEYLIRGRWKTEKRPLLINSWEAAYFDFDTDKLISFAERAKETGIEMLVMDDGWFGRRNDDTTSLGDWYINTENLV